MKVKVVNLLAVMALFLHLLKILDPLSGLGLAITC